MKSFAELPGTTLLAICDRLGGDGHGLYDPSLLSELGVPDELVLSVTQTYKSDPSSVKGTIFGPDGNPITEMTAVYSLSLYRRINRDLGLPGSDMNGRGSEARELHGQIKEFVKQHV